MLMLQKVYVLFFIIAEILQINMFYDNFCVFYCSLICFLHIIICTRLGKQCFFGTKFIIMYQYYTFVILILFYNLLISLNALRFSRMLGNFHEHSFFSFAFYFHGIYYNVIMYQGIMFFIYNFSFIIHNKEHAV